MTPEAAQSALLRRIAPYAVRLLEQAAAPANWKIDPARFAAALARSATHRFGASEPGARELDGYLNSLHIADLALASACRDGSESAWRHLVERFRAGLYRAGEAVGGASGRELADSLWAELYGLPNAAGERRSLLDYFHGRSSLATWLRAVLAQRYVDEVRRTRKLDALPEEEGAVPPALRTSGGSDGAGAPDPEAARLLPVLQETLEQAIRTLEPRARLRLRLYYSEGLTLAEVGRVTREHESGVSRKLARTCRELRARVEELLRETRKLSAPQIELCFSLAAGEWPYDLSAALLGNSPSRTAGDARSTTSRVLREEGKAR